jgi:hypothetical protein
MTNVVVFCGICGYHPGIEMDVDEALPPEQLREAVLAELGGEKIRCDRCGSLLVPESGTMATGEPPRLAMAREAEAMRRKIRGVRFAVGAPDGARGAIWRIWVNRSDVYVAARATASDMKVSLHASGQWRAAFTEAHQRRKEALIPPDQDRAVDKWDRPTEFVPGWTRAFEIIVPASEVVESEEVIEKPEEVVWIDTLPDGWATHFNIVLGAPGATGSDGRGFPTAEGREDHTDVVTVLELENGERVWVLVSAHEYEQEWVEGIYGRLPADVPAVIEKVRAEPGPHDIRFFASGIAEDGTRFYLDLACPI